MRPIDADKLSKRFMNMGQMFNRTEIVREIANAPTVEIPNYAMGYQDGVRKVLKEVAEGKHRPQGEWIYEEGWNAYCSNCSVPTKHETNFCPYCGADMRGKEDG